MTFPKKLSPILFFLITVMGMPVFGSNVQTGMPKLYLPETIIDLGTVIQDERASGKFVIGNDGSGVLLIREIRTSCGCTVARPEKDNIEAKEQVEVNVTINTVGKTGNIQKVITVTTNDPDTPLTQIKVKARVLARKHGHMQKDNSLFKGLCADCHANPAKGKAGAQLFDAVCAMCHNRNKEIGSPQQQKFINIKDYTDSYVENIITRGKLQTSMPGFSKSAGGPLDGSQILSLVDFLQESK